MKHGREIQTVQATKI